jgi:Zn ribbon nucleic-acid-binding protein
MPKCPGQDTQQWRFDALYEVSCKKCGHRMEFFKDDLKRRCKKCGTLVFNDRMDLGCLAWCPMAEMCMGPDKAKALEFAASSSCSPPDRVKALMGVKDGQE